MSKEFDLELKCEKTGLTGLFCKSSRDEKHQKEQIEFMKERIKKWNEKVKKEKLNG
jgi:hypothetical protein